MPPPQSRQTPRTPPAIHIHIFDDPAGFRTSGTFSRRCRGAGGGTDGGADGAEPGRTAAGATGIAAVGIGTTNTAWHFEQRTFFPAACSGTEHATPHAVHFTFIDGSWKSL